MMKITDAVKSFEKLFGCRISFHDYSGCLKNISGMKEYLSHFNPFCDYVKNRNVKNLKLCVAMDSEILRKHLSENPIPVFKICHAGVLELCVPVFSSAKLIGAMFAGPFHPAADTSSRIEFLRQKLRSGNFEKLALANLRKINEKEFPELLNMAILLAAYIGTSVSVGEEPLIACGSDKKILFFFEREFSSKDVSLEKLASFLNLGLSRTSQLLRKHFNKTFSELLMEKRIEHARYLLRETFFNTEHIARTCGFSDPSYFFRVFKSFNSGTTPGEYRKKERTFSLKNAEMKI